MLARFARQAQSERTRTLCHVFYCDRGTFLPARITVALRLIEPSKTLRFEQLAQSQTCRAKSVTPHLPFLRR